MIISDCLSTHIFVSIPFFKNNDKSKNTIYVDKEKQNIMTKTL